MLMTVINKTLLILN